MGLDGSGALVGSRVVGKGLGSDGSGAFVDSRVEGKWVEGTGEDEGGSLMYASLPRRDHAFSLGEVGGMGLLGEMLVMVVVVGRGVGRVGEVVVVVVVGLL